MTWVKPELVCQVKFTQWTQDERLRAPVYLGLREDVKPREVHARRLRAGFVRTGRVLARCQRSDAATSTARRSSSPT